MIGIKCLRLALMKPRVALGTNRGTTMRYLILALALLFATITVAEQPQIDTDLALAAGRGYVESYLRWHLHSPTPRIDWANATIDVVSFKHGGWDGYVGVFFPDIDGTGGGTVYFEYGNLNPGYMFPVQFGHTGELSKEAQDFRAKAAVGLIPKGPAL